MLVIERTDIRDSDIFDRSVNEIHDLADRRTKRGTDSVALEILFRFFLLGTKP